MKYTVAHEVTRVEKYEATAKVWGFLKYYHPKVCKGKFNWDEELIKTLSSVDTVQSKEEFSNLILEWMNSLGKIKKVKRSADKSSNTYPNKSHLEWLNDTSIFTTQLIHALKYVEENRKRGASHYMGISSPGIYKQKNAIAYENFEYPGTSYRLLTLFTYWNIVEYFFPYKYLCDDAWGGILKEMIPKFINAADTIAYHLSIKELVAKTNDSHSFFQTKYTNDYFGRYWMPIRFKMINNQLVVNGFYNDSLALADDFQIGDIILEVDGRKVADIINERKKYVAASNTDGMHRNMYQMILNGHSNQGHIKLKRSGNVLEKQVKRYTFSAINFSSQAVNKRTYEIFENNLGYVNMGWLTKADVGKVIDSLLNCKGLILDLRNYPKGTVYALANRLLAERTAFAKFSKFDYNYPGNFWLTRAYYCGGNAHRTPQKRKSSKEVYQGKVVILVNETTQSHAEFTCMCLQTGENVKVIGSQTAGADGNVTRFELPGGYQTSISGLGVYYPNGDETQRVGVRVDVTVKPTIEGIQAGRDEVLEQAVKLLLQQAE